MCGIIGVIGTPDAAGVLVKALERLTYRGYDSAGIITSFEGKAYCLKRSGKIQALCEALESNPCPGSVGLGHTRWATHGAATEANAHPHKSSEGSIYVVCNGIIENFRTLKKGLEAQGYRFSSETDTEVLPVLLESYGSKLSLEEKIIKMVSEIEGSFAIAAFDTKNPDHLWAARRGSPLLIASTDTTSYLTSDIPAILEHTNQVIYLEDNEIAQLSPGQVKLMNFQGELIERLAETINFTLEQAKKEGYPHFMLKEIHEQPLAIEKTLKTYLTPQGIDFSRFLDEEALKGIQEVVFVACGTAYFAGLVGQYLFDSLGIRTRSFLASEFHLFPPPSGAQTLVIAVTQSGETIDTLYALRRAKAMGAKTLAICNVKGSTITREADMALMMQSGIEIGVASTKAYSTMIVVVEMLGPWLASYLKIPNQNFDLDRHLDELKKIPQKVKQVLDSYGDLKVLLENFSHLNDYFYIARGFNLPTALEGALKLKELTYLHAEGYGAGEMKHGPIALVDKKLLTVAIAPLDGLEDKMASNIEEIRARNGRVFLVSSENSSFDSKLIDWEVKVPQSTRELTPLLTIVPLQILAYEVAISRGCDPDQPRNLAKSVTVE